MKTSAVVTLCSAALAAGLVFSAAPAAAQSAAPNRNKICNDQWNAKKAANDTAGLKYADFRRECLARTAAAPADANATAPANGAPPAAEAPPAPPRTRTRTAAPKPAAAGEAGDAVFPTAVSDKYSGERPGLARMHTCRDQYQENKATNANGGLNWLQKGGGYYSECNKRLKGEG